MSWQTTLRRLLLIELQSATFNARQAAAVRGVFVLRLGKLLQSKQNIGKDRGQRQGCNCNCNAIKCHKINRRFPRLKIFSCKNASTHLQPIIAGHANYDVTKSNAKLPEALRGGEWGDAPRWKHGRVWTCAWLAWRHGVALALLNCSSCHENEIATRPSQVLNVCES